jgi:hypothetical protein
MDGHQPISAHHELKQLRISQVQLPTRPNQHRINQFQLLTSSNQLRINQFQLLTS